MTIDELVENALAGALSRYFESRVQFDEQFIDRIADRVCERMAFMQREAEMQRQQAALQHRQLMQQYSMGTAIPPAMKPYGVMSGDLK